MSIATDARQFTINKEDLRDKVRQALAVEGNPVPTDDLSALRDRLPEQYRLPGTCEKVYRTLRNILSDLRADCEVGTYIKYKQEYYKLLTPAERDEALERRTPKTRERRYHSAKPASWS